MRPNLYHDFFFAKVVCGMLRHGTCVIICIIFFVAQLVIIQRHSTNTKMMQIMTHGSLHAAYHQEPQTEKDDTNYDACSVCQQRNSQTKKMIQIMTHGSLHAAYHPAPQTQKDDTKYDACPVCQCTTLAKK